METANNHSKNPGHDRIPILPTRHGNNITIQMIKIPTPIPILPTRHGNSARFPTCFAHLESFRSYLRGMETLTDVYVFFDVTNIPILPTRHGNCYWVRQYFSRPFIPILPTRHGNPFRSLSPVHSYLIPILPTRHGNCRITLFNAPETSIFRSYLRGMEIRRRTVSYHTICRFRSYL